MTTRRTVSTNGRSDHRWAFRGSILAGVAVAGLCAPAAAHALPPHPFGPPALTIGCANQGSLMSLTGATGQSGPEQTPPIGPGEIRFESFPAAPPIPAAGQVTVAWINLDTGATGIAALEGTYPYHSKTVYTGTGNIRATVFGTIDLGSLPLCQSNPTFGNFIV
ncbi:hypothetical protein AB4Z09_07685 [Rhodococcus sp. TAF43]|uniref:hypothetical protein n=1 Tax=unclassified Rhodococcus (in: high G+C Gram-positive bacteria) TaxID=192944 RepID=UPI0020C5E8B7|nr:hypothetical protein [Rhodococcus sp. W8901]